MAPTNLTPETATAIPTFSLPYSITVSAADLSLTPAGSGYVSTCDSTQRNALWWTYTTGPHENWLSITAGQASFTDYNPNVSVWTGPPLAQVTLSGQNFCTALQGRSFLMSALPNTRYYFLVTNQDPTAPPFTNSLTFSVAGAPSVAAPAGSLVISDETVGFRSTVVGTDGTFRRMLTWASGGELGDRFGTGEACVQVNSAQSSVLNIYSSDLSTLLVTHDFTDQIFAIKSDRSSLCYIITGVGTGAKTVRTINVFGSVGSTTWTLPANSGVATMFAVNQAGTRLYYGQIATASAPIHAYNLQSSSALADLTAGIGTERLRGTGDGFCLSDGSICFGYCADADGGTGKIRRFDTAGTVLHTYSLSDADFVRFNHFAYATESAFWAWAYTTVGAPIKFSSLKHIQISDGAELAALVVPTTGSSGIGYAPVAMEASCPLFVVGADLPAPPLAPPTPPPLPPAAQWDVRPIRRLRRAPHLSQEMLIHWYEQFQLDINAGDGQNLTPRKFELRWSNDGGATWSSIHEVTADRQGQYTFRAIWRRLGPSRDRIFEVVDSNDANSIFLDAFVTITKGTK